MGPCAWPGNRFLCVTQTGVDNRRRLYNRVCWVFRDHPWQTKEKKGVSDTFCNTQNTCRWALEEGENKRWERNRNFSNYSEVRLKFVQARVMVPSKSAYVFMFSSPCLTKSIEIRPASHWIVSLFLLACYTKKLLTIFSKVVFKRSLRKEGSYSSKSRLFIRNDKISNAWRRMFPSSCLEKWIWRESRNIFFFF